MFADCFFQSHCFYGTWSGALNFHDIIWTTCHWSIYHNMKEKSINYWCTNYSYFNVQLKSRIPVFWQQYCIVCPAFVIFFRQGFFFLITHLWSYFICSVTKERIIIIIIFSYLKSNWGHFAISNLTNGIKLQLQKKKNHFYLAVFAFCNADHIKKGFEQSALLSIK